MFKTFSCPASFFHRGATRTPTPHHDLRDARGRVSLASLPRIARSSPPIARSSEGGPSLPQQRSSDSAARNSPLAPAFNGLSLPPKWPAIPAPAPPVTAPPPPPPPSPSSPPGAGSASAPPACCSTCSSSTPSYSLQPPLAPATPHGRRFLPPRRRRPHRRQARGRRAARHRHARRRRARHRRQPRGRRARLAPQGRAGRPALGGQVHRHDLRARHRRLRRLRGGRGSLHARRRRRGRAAQSCAAQGDRSGYQVRLSLLDPVLPAVL